MNSTLTISVSLFLTIISSHSLADEANLPDCMTEVGAFEIQQIKRDAIVQRKGLFATIGYSQALKTCESKGSIYAKYILAKDDLITAKMMKLQADTNKYLGDSEKQFAIKESLKILDKVVSNLKDLSEIGYPLATYSLGNIYFEGDLMARNKTTAGIYFVRAGFQSYEDNRKDLMNTCFERAKETVPDHPELPKLKSLVYQ